MLACFANEFEVVLNLGLALRRFVHSGNWAHRDRTRLSLALRSRGILHIQTLMPSFNDEARSLWGPKRQGYIPNFRIVGAFRCSASAGSRSRWKPAALRVARGFSLCLYYL